MMSQVAPRSQRNGSKCEDDCRRAKRLLPPGAGQLLDQLVDEREDDRLQAGN